jgi:glycosyltransferase involved in cell wall biosynthesis
MAARLVHTPVVIHTAHGFPVHKSRALLRLFLLLERLASRWCDRTIAISQPIIDWLIQTRIAEAGNLVKIFSGIETERFQSAKSDPALRRELGVADDQVAVGVVSKLWEGKGHEVLIDAFSLLVKTGRRVRLLIVGEGHLEAALQARVKRMGLDHCTTFTGFRSDIPEITAILDIAVLPSFYEGMGRVILEAMAAGKPVVASRVGGIVELVEEGVTGFLVPPGDSAALADRLDRLVSDPELRERFGRLAAKRTGEHFSAAAMVRQIHEVYCAELRRVSSGQARGRRCAGGRKG